MTDFTEDWTTTHFPIWKRLLAEHHGGLRTGLEIGSFEGRSAVFWLEHLQALHLTCVDLFAYTDGFFPTRIGTPFADRFDENLAPYKGRYTKVVSDSASALSRFVAEKKLFDLIYVDGSHFRDDSMVDCLLAWKILDQQGLMIIDDYLWGWQHPPHGRPKEAIEWFIGTRLSELDIVHNGIQIAIRKR
jgi:Methyltransferase domain